MFTHFTVRMGFNWPLSAMPYGEGWRQGRKLLHSHLHSGVVPTYQPVQLSSARRLIADLLHAKHDKNVLPAMIRINFGTSITEITYGIDVQSGGKEHVSVAEECLHAGSEATIPGRFLVDVLPICSSFLRMFSCRHTL
jgi:cytochrome P450